MNKVKTNVLIVVMALLALSGCKKDGEYNQPASYVKANDELIECTSKLDKSVILYYKSDAKEYKPENLPVTIYYIHDVNGKLFSLNNFEIENYTCSKIENNK